MLLLLPTMCSAANATSARVNRTSSGMPCAAWLVTATACSPSVRPGCGKNTSRIFANRSSGLYEPLLTRWQSVHSLSPTV